MDPLTSKEKALVRAALHFEKVQVRLGCIPDYEIIMQSELPLTQDELRGVRDEVQALMRART